MRKTSPAKNDDQNCNIAVYREIFTLPPLTTTHHHSLPNTIFFTTHSQHPHLFPHLIAEAWRSWFGIRRAHTEVGWHFRRTVEDVSLTVTKRLDNVTTDVVPYDGGEDDEDGEGDGKVSKHTE